MPKKESPQKETPQKEASYPNGTKFEIMGVVIIALSFLLAAGLLDFSVGRIGYFSAKVLRYGFGVGAPGIVFL